VDPDEVRAWAPGRVNLIGEHVDYVGGLALPMAVDLGTTITGRRVGDWISLDSDDEPERCELPLALDEPAAVSPAWARYVAGVVAELAPSVGFDGTVVSTLPIGAGLSSSASLELATALALGFDGGPHDLARLGQRAEQAASGVPCGLMDQLASACGVDGHALLIDFRTDAVEPVPVPPDMEIVVVHSGVSRQLARSAYAERRASCEDAAATLGVALRDATLDDVASLSDPVLRHRARHVVSENQRVLAAVEAMRAGDAPTAGAILVEGHVSLRDDFEVSLPEIDALVDRLIAAPGVHGARITGAGFGGCVVALTEPGALDEGWHVRPAAGARLIDA
jgi:galactokinase